MEVKAIFLLKCNLVHKMGSWKFYGLYSWSLWPTHRYLFRGTRDRNM